MKKYILGLFIFLGTVPSVHAQADWQSRMSGEYCVDLQNTSYRAYLGMSDVIILREAIASPNDTSRIPNSISNLQRFLIQQKHAAFTNTTGYYGVGTRRAVQAFQRAYGITPTGNVGPATRAKIKDVLGCGGAQSNNTTGFNSWTSYEYGVTAKLPVTYSENPKIIDRTSYKEIMFESAYVRQSKILPVSIIAVPIRTWNKWYVSHEENHPFSAPVGANELLRNDNYVIATYPRFSSMYDGLDANDPMSSFIKEQAEFIIKNISIAGTQKPTYPQNLSISGFKIVNGKAYATILDKCTAERTVCDYDNPTVPLLQEGTPLITTDGYVIGLYRYGQTGIGRFVNGNNYEYLVDKFLVLVGKDGKWRYDYLDCKNVELGCSYATYGVDPDSKNIYFGSGGRDQSGIVYMNAEKFLASKKSHFVLNGY